MHVHVLQHVGFEGLGRIAGWLTQRGARVSCTRFFDAEQLPSLDDIDLIIALGGPMSVNDEDQFHWLRDEKRFIADAVASNKAVLGICLGAQLIASALGARVYPGVEKEIGWFPVYAEPGAPDSFAFPASIEVFHWHGETFDLPADAIHLASSVACRNQAFQIGRRVVGLQFHLETTPDSAGSIITHCADELVAGRFIQSESDLRNTPGSRYVAINALMEEVLDYLTSY
ncbi:MAG: gamma-glutamyl-gamma-aminobutyrate hydrolase family protein [Aquisalimonadaceae bacterium]